jgi:hypothetical protein
MGIGKISYLIVLIWDWSGDIFYDLWIRGKNSGLSFLKSIVELLEFRDSLFQNSMIWKLMPYGNPKISNLQGLEILH